MAPRKTAKKKAAKKSAKKAPRKAAKKAARKAASRSAAKASRKKKPVARRAAAKKPAGPPAIRHGVITHTELASADPLATKAWCESVLGWQFGEPFPTQGGPYHMWRFPNDTGGGIRSNNPPEVPGSIPYCEVHDIRETYEKALAGGATEMVPPMQLPSGMGWIAIVCAPGGVAFGFWAMK